MGNKTLDEVGKDLNIPPEKPKGTGRPVGVKGALPALKSMSKPDLMKELGKARKSIKALEAQLMSIKPQVEDVSIIPPELWAVFPAMGYEYLSMRYGDHWKLEKNEIQLYGESIEKVANRYLPDMAKESPELVGLCIVVISTTLPRIVLTLKAKEIEESPKEEKKKPNGPNSDKQT